MENDHPTAATKTKLINPFTTKAKLTALFPFLGHNRTVNITAVQNATTIPSSQNTCTA